MILDKENLFSDDQAITVTADATNVIDLGNDDAKVQALNEKGDVKILCQVTTAFAGGTSIAAVVKSDDSSTMASATTLITTAAINTASLVAGYQFTVSGLPLINEQYLGMSFTVVGTMSAGAITAGIVRDLQTNV